MIALLWIVFCFLLVLLFLLIYDEMKIRKMKQKVEELVEETTNLKNKPQDKKVANRRKAFRVHLHNEDCIMELLEFKDPKLDQLKHKQIQGFIHDLSFTGLRFETQYDLPVRKGILVNVQFNLKDHLFSLKARLVRKEEKMDNDKVIYGLEFVQVKTSEEFELKQILNQILLEQRQKMA